MSFFSPRILDHHLQSWVEWSESLQPWNKVERNIQLCWVFSDELEQLLLLGGSAYWKWAACFGHGSILPLLSEDLQNSVYAEGRKVYLYSFLLLFHHSELVVFSFFFFFLKLFLFITICFILWYIFTVASCSKYSEIETCWEYYLECSCEPLIHLYCMT